MSFWDAVNLISTAIDRAEADRYREEEALENAPPQCRKCGDEFTIVRGDADDALFCDPCAQEIACEWWPSGKGIAFDKTALESHFPSVEVEHFETNGPSMGGAELTLTFVGGAELTIYRHADGRIIVKADRAEGPAP